MFLSSVDFIWQHKRTSFFFALLLAILVALLQVNSAGALPGDSTGIIPNNGTSSPWLVVTRPGGNGMDAPESTTKIYVPVSLGMTFDMTIQDACDGTGNDNSGWNNNTVFIFPGSIVSNVQSLSGGTIAVSFLGSWFVRCDSGTNSVVRVTMNGSAPIRTIGSQSYRVIAPFSASTDNSLSTSYYVNRFRFFAGGGILFGYASSVAQPTTSLQYTGIAANSGGSNSWGWETTISFALPCNTGFIDGQRVYFFDTDHSGGPTSVSPYWQNTNQPMRYTIRRYNRQTDALLQTIWSNEWLTGGNSGSPTEHDATQSFRIDSQYKYTVTVSNINYINSIQVALPVDAIYSVDPCPAVPATNWNYEHTLSVAPGSPPSSYPNVAPGSTITVSDNIQNNGNGDGRPYTQTFEIYRDDAPGWNPYNTLSGQGGLAANGGNRTNSAPYTLPTNIPNGTRVCFSSVVNPSAGQTTPISTVTGGAIRSNYECVRVQQLPPSCGSNGVTFNTASTIAVGSSFRSYVDVDNTNNYTLSVSSVSYVVRRTSNNVIPAGTNTSRTYNPVGNIAANDTDDTAEYWTAGGQNITINEVGTFRVTWTINTSNGVIPCFRNITTTFTAPTCTANTFNISVGQSASPTFTLLNNSNIAVAVTGASLAITGPQNVNATVPATSRPTLPAGTSTVRTYPNPIRYDPGNTTSVGPFNTAGTYNTSWTVTWSVAGQSGTIPAAQCTNIGGSTVALEPYARFYGNDVVACNSEGSYGGNISVNSRRSSANTSGAIGSASQLAVFAAGLNSQLVPGAQRSRGIRDLMFANTGGVPAFTGAILGGQLADNNCDSRTITNQISTIDTTGYDPAGNIATLNGLSSGGYIRSVNTLVAGNPGNSSASVSNNIIIYVTGNVTIGNNIIYSGGLGSWNIGSIPSVKVYATGNIYINNNVTRLDGEYVAGGEIHTCSNAGSNLIATAALPATQAFIANSCRNRLIVNGNFKARRVHFLRSVGNVRDGVAYEVYNRTVPLNPNAVIAESLRFSPEAYLLPTSATVSESQNDVGPEYQSIISRPPTF